MNNGYLLKIFGGNFNGNNHTIYNLTINDSVDNMYSGFFGRALFGDISNLKFENLNINVNSCTYVGALAGSSSRAKIENISINNSSITGKSSVGGIIGAMSSGTVSRSSVTNSKISAEYIIGGIVASPDGEITLKDLYSNATITTSSSSGLGTGGIIGKYEDSKSNLLTMQNVLFTGKITGKGDNVGAIYGSIEVGGEACDNDITGSNGTWLYDKNQIGLTEPKYLERGVAKTTDELKKASTYSGWSNEIWNIVDGAYPTLK